MAPVKRETQAKRVAASRRLLDYMTGDTWAPRGRLEQLLSDLPEVKGLFSRAAKRDQWDWFTVWEQLGRPTERTASEAARALKGLRSGLRDGQDAAATLAASRFHNDGGLSHLQAYVAGVDPRTSGAGFLYVLSTRAAPRMLKIGFTDRSVRERVNELNAASAVPVPYGARGVWVSTSARALEGQVHSALEPYRVRRDREFFEVDFRTAAAVIDEVLADAGDRPAISV